MCSVHSGVASRLHDRPQERIARTATELMLTRESNQITGRISLPSEASEQI